jgi:hypothetical protein
MNIAWEKLNNADLSLIHEITKRYVKMTGNRINQMTVEMDISACHISGNPLDLERLLSAKDFDFIHDIGGIRVSIDRETGKLMNCFDPRYSKKSK